MRYVLPLVCAAAAVSAQTVNTQVNGLVLTNGLSSLSDSSGIYNGLNTSYGITYLTDNDTTTLIFNIGVGVGGSIRGTFGGTVSSSATGVYIIGTAEAGSWNSNVPTLYNGPTFSVQLDLVGGLTSSRNYGDANFFITSQTILIASYYQNGFNGITTGSYVVNASFDPSVDHLVYSYAYIPFSDFGATYDQVLGIKLGNFTSQYPDIGYIGLGYAGAAPAVPESSTYGLALGGLALVGAVIRRRSKRA